MLSDVRLDAKVLHEVDEQRFRETVSADQADLMGLARPIQGCAIINHLRPTDTWDLHEWLGTETVQFDGLIALRRYSTIEEVKGVVLGW